MDRCRQQPNMNRMSFISNDLSGSTSVIKTNAAFTQIS